MTKEEALSRLDGTGVDVDQNDLNFTMSLFITVVTIGVVNMIYREGMEICDRTMPDDWFDKNVKTEREN